MHDRFSFTNNELREGMTRFDQLVYDQVTRLRCQGPTQGTPTSDTPTQDTPTRNTLGFGGNEVMNASGGSCSSDEDESSAVEMESTFTHLSALSNMADVAVSQRDANNNLGTLCSDEHARHGLPEVARNLTPLLDLAVINLEAIQALRQSGTSLSPQDTQANNQVALRQSANKHRSFSPAGRHPFNRQTNASNIKTFKDVQQNSSNIRRRAMSLEQQLQNYTSPALLTSLNRRTSKATGEADCIAKLVDKLRKTSRKSALDPNMRLKAIDLSLKLKGLLSRQKSEWQCVGRLRETVAMAREIKDVLRFVCQLSTLLQQDANSCAQSTNKPPPYEDTIADIKEHLRGRSCSPRMFLNHDIMPSLSDITCCDSVSDLSFEMQGYGQAHNSSSDTDIHHGNLKNTIKRALRDTVSKHSDGDKRTDIAKRKAHFHGREDSGKIFKYCSNLFNKMVQSTEESSLNVDTDVDSGRQSPCRKYKDRSPEMIPRSKGQSAHGDGHLDLLCKAAIKLDTRRAMSCDLNKQYERRKRKMRGKSEVRHRKRRRDDPVSITTTRENKNNAHKLDTPSMSKTSARETTPTNVTSLVLATKETDFNASSIPAMCGSFNSSSVDPPRTEKNTSQHHRPTMESPQKSMSMDIGDQVSRPFKFSPTRSANDGTLPPKNLAKNAKRKELRRVSSAGSISDYSTEESEYSTEQSASSTERSHSYIVDQLYRNPSVLSRSSFARSRSYIDVVDSRQPSSESFESSRSQRSQQSSPDNWRYGDSVTSHSDSEYYESQLRSTESYTTSEDVTMTRQVKPRYHPRHSRNPSSEPSAVRYESSPRSRFPSSKRQRSTGSLSSGHRSLSAGRRPLGFREKGSRLRRSDMDQEMSRQASARSHDAYHKHSQDGLQAPHDGMVEGQVRTPKHSMYTEYLGEESPRSHGITESRIFGKLKKISNHTAVSEEEERVSRRGSQQQTGSGRASRRASQQRNAEDCPSEQKTCCLRLKFTPPSSPGDCNKTFKVCASPKRQTECVPEEEEEECEDEEEEEEEYARREDCQPQGGMLGFKQCRQIVAKVFANSKCNNQQQQKCSQKRAKSAPLPKKNKCASHNRGCGGCCDSSAPQRTKRSRCSQGRHRSESNSPCPKPQSTDGCRQQSNIKICSGPVRVKFTTRQCPGVPGGDGAAVVPGASQHAASPHSASQVASPIRSIRGSTQEMRIPTPNVAAAFRQESGSATPSNQINGAYDEEAPQMYDEEEPEEQEENFEDEYENEIEQQFEPSVGGRPSQAPTKAASVAPSKAASKSQNSKPPSGAASRGASSVPSSGPNSGPNTNRVSGMPSQGGMSATSKAPSAAPSKALSGAPSKALSGAPSNALSAVPSNMSGTPSKAPSQVPGSATHTAVPSMVNQVEVDPDDPNSAPLTEGSTAEEVPEAGFSDFMKEWGPFMFLSFLLFYLMYFLLCGLLSECVPCGMPFSGLMSWVMTLVNRNIKLTHYTPPPL